MWQESSFGVRKLTLLMTKYLVKRLNNKQITWTIYEKLIYSNLKVNIFK